MNVIRYFAASALVSAMLFVPLTSVSFAAKKSGKWTFVSKTDGVLVHRKKVTGSKLFAFRGVMTAQIHIGKLISVLSQSHLRKKWVANFHSSGNLAKPSELERVYWIRFDLPWPAWDRDFVFYTKAYPDLVKRTFIARIKSTTHKGFPKQKCCVRAYARGTYYKFTAIKQKKGSTAPPRTKIEVEVHTDPKGMLPAWLINRIQAKWPNKTLRNLLKIARKTKSHPLLVHWHSYKPLYEHYRNLPKGLPKGFKLPKGFLPKAPKPKAAKPKAAKQPAKQPAPRVAPRPAPKKK